MNGAPGLTWKEWIVYLSQRLRGRPAELQRLHGLLRLPKRQPGVLPWRGRALRYADGPSLFYQLQDIYGHRSYDFQCAEPEPRILDVGGNIGLAVWRLRERHPRARITTFEPDPALVGILRANLATIGDRETVVVPAAAWNAKGEQTFCATGDDSGHLDESGTVRVPTVDLAEYCTQPVDFLKLDIEGAELPVLQHLAAAGALARLRRLFVEVHGWGEAPPPLPQMLELFDQAGLKWRISSAVCLGASPQPAGFDAVAHPANLVTLHVWQPN